jgi:hypothetical protein
MLGLNEIGLQWEAEGGGPSHYEGDLLYLEHVPSTFEYNQVMFT